MVHYVLFFFFFLCCSQEKRRRIFFAHCRGKSPQMNKWIWFAVCSDWDDAFRIQFRCILSIYGCILKYAILFIFSLLIFWFGCVASCTNRYLTRALFCIEILCTLYEHWPTTRHILSVASAAITAILQASSMQYPM